ncbi:hypothetical protein AQJ23_00075 [Streptomyces antibioticus]|nr:hypothetical protein AQJ23_00075 [Streptomyces antibioticus]
MYSHAQWESALHDAQQEGSQRQHQQIIDFRRKTGKDLRFVRPHQPALDADIGDLSERSSERAAMNRFIHESRSATPSYLCWQADTPVGKTTLLADYVLRPPRYTDVLNFFISPTHGNTRADFETEMALQLTLLLQLSESSAPSSIRGPRQWRRLFAAAAAKSVAHGRKLLLVVDGLDDDVAWSGTAGGDAAPPSRNRGNRRSADGSIAALLPLAPPPGMRVIASFRRWGHGPHDLPRSHPLQRPEHRRTLQPIAGLRPLPRTAPGPPLKGTHDTVARLLAVAGGGLHATDLAELTGRPLEQITSVLQGPQGRTIMIDDAVFETYRLQHPDQEAAVRCRMEETALARHTQQLLDWCERWRTSGWPEQTPLYPLVHQLRLLADTAQRAAYVLDWPRLERLATTAGPAAALAQLDTFALEISTEEPSSGSLNVLVPLACARATLCGKAQEVPRGAAGLLVRLGQAQRARSLARSAPTAQMRAIHLADVAVEMARGGQTATSVAVAHEAADCLPPFHPLHPQTARDPAAHSHLLDAARSLLALDLPHAAHPLLRAVVGDRGAEIETRCAAAAMLHTAHDPQATTALIDHVQSLSEGGLRERAAAVELWGILARAIPTFGRYAGDRIEALCADLAPSEGLGSIEVLALAASALAQLPARRHKKAGILLRQALAQIAAALSDPATLSADDHAYLSRDLAGALAHLTQAVDAAGTGRGALTDIDRLLQALPEHLRTGILGDTIAERAQFLAHTAAERRATEDAAATTKTQQRKNAQRRAKQWMLAPAQFAPPTGAQPEETARKNSLTATRRTPTHPATSALPDPADPAALVLSAEEHLTTGNLHSGRELLATALQRASTPSTYAPTAQQWTADLAQALGVAGEFEHGEALASEVADMNNRVRHLAALSLGCALGGHEHAAARYAHQAADLLPADAPPTLKNTVAQALAHAADAPAALATAGGNTAAERRQALTAIAAGLAPHDPDHAAHITEPLITDLAQRIDQGSPLHVLPELAALLLAAPTLQHPQPRLHETLQHAAHHARTTPQTRHIPTLTILTLLAHLGCLPHTTTDRIPLTHRHAAHPPRHLPPEQAVLAAVQHDTTALHQLTRTSQGPDQDPAALYAAAAHLSASPTTLTTDHRAPDKTTRLCLALAHTADRTTSATTTAHRITHHLLTRHPWTHTLPLLPQLAPQALLHLARMAASTGIHSISPQ